MLELPLGPCVFTVLDFHKVDVLIPARNQGGDGCIFMRRRAGSAQSDQDEVWVRARCQSILRQNFEKPGGPGCVCVCPAWWLLAEATSHLLQGYRQSG